jgi:nucleotide-binding universal stress UspA family protein
MLFKNILMPTDFSHNSVQAYEIALDFAKKYSAKLHLLHVIEPLIYNQENSEYLNKINFDRDRLFNAEEDLERFINNYSNSDVNIYRIVLAGKPYEEILRYAKNENIDLIVIAAHGKTNLHHVVAGNVAKKILKYSKLPVVCIKTKKTSLPRENEARENLAENWVG